MTRMPNGGPVSPSGVGSNTHGMLGGCRAPAMTSPTFCLVVGRNRFDVTAVVVDMCLLGRGVVRNATNVARHPVPRPGIPSPSLPDQATPAGRTSRARRGPRPP